MRPARDFSDLELDQIIASMGTLLHRLRLERDRRRRLEAAATGGRTGMTKRQYSVYRKLVTGGLDRDAARAEATMGDLS